MSEEYRDQVLRLLAEARELIIGQQAMPFDGRQLLQRCGTSQVVQAQPRAIAEKVSNPIL